MWLGTYQLGCRKHGSRANGQSEAQSGRESEGVGRHCVRYLEVDL